MKLSLFDTHCDTAYELFHRGVHLESNEGCHISLDKAVCYDRYAQYYAVWSNRRLDDETCWEHFLKIAALYVKSACEIAAGKRTRASFLFDQCIHTEIGFPDIAEIGTGNLDHIYLTFPVLFIFQKTTHL